MEKRTKLRMACDRYYGYFNEKECWPENKDKFKATLKHGKIHATFARLYANDSPDKHGPDFGRVVEAAKIKYNKISEQEIEYEKFEAKKRLFGKIDKKYSGIFNTFKRHRLRKKLNAKDSHKYIES